MAPDEPSAPQPGATEGGAAPPPSPRKTARRDSVLRGVGLTFVLHVGALLVAGLAASIPGAGRVGGYVGLSILLGIGLFQWLYLIPVIRWANRRGWRDLARGLWIGGAITFLLSLTCWGVPFLMSRFAG